jgi:hypothetical protein
LHGLFGLGLNNAHEGQGDTRSLGADGIWGLLGRPPERAGEHAPVPTFDQHAINVSAASGLYPPDLQDAAVQNVLQQAEALSAEWAA